MLVSSFRAGLIALRARPTLALLLFGLHLFFAGLLAVPIASVLQSATAGTGFDADLASGLDLVLLVDIMFNNQTLLATPIALLAWLVPLLLVWKAVMGVGLVHALASEPVGGFWAGVGRHGKRGVLLSLVYLAPILVVGALTAILGVALVLLFPGEIGRFWSVFVFAPLFFIWGIATVDLMHDYSRLALVMDGRPVIDSFIAGFRFPFRYGVSAGLYLLWFVPGVLLWAAPTLVEATVGMSALVFIAQQVLMLGRAGVTVAWFGSEVALFRAVSPLVVEVPAAESEFETDFPTPAEPEFETDPPTPTESEFATDFPTPVEPEFETDPPTPAERGS